MKGYYRKIFIYIFCALAVVTVFLLMNNGVLIETKSYSMEVDLEDPVDTLPQEEMDAQKKTVLVLYDPEEELSVKYAGNLQRVLHRMDLTGDFMDGHLLESISYSDYDLVTVAFSDWDGLLEEDCQRLLHYVEQGGKLFLGMLPTSPDVVYRALYRAMGVVEYGDYVQPTSLNFKEELLAGSKGRSFEGEIFSDAALGVQIDSRAQLYVTGNVEGREVPLVWKNAYGEGAVLVFNATAISGDAWTGVASGCLATLFEDYLYPVINAKTIFIDDFPSPMYNVENSSVERDYNRTVREFLRDIWWPDMQSAATRFSYKYVGLFIATYDDVVNPDLFAYSKDSVEQYFGNSLLENGFEMGAHGYNHQSLALEGQVPDDLDYNAWADTEDMAASLEKLRQITEELFPGVNLYTYVPPSNYLSQEGRQAVVEALPDLQVISGVYTMEGEEGSVYVQDYTVAEDGIVEFPRATSGMLEDPFDDFTAMNIAGLYGVYSHFIHPDDILDEERSGGKDWQTLFSDFCDKLNLINEYFEGFRPFTAVEAAQAVRVAEQVEVAFTVENGRMSGSCNGFTGEAWCYLRTDKIPEVDNESCQITRVCSDYQGAYYLVQIKEPEFSFALREREP